MSKMGRVLWFASIFFISLFTFTLFLEKQLGKDPSLIADNSLVAKGGHGGGHHGGHHGGHRSHHSGKHRHAHGQHHWNHHHEGSFWHHNRRPAGENHRGNRWHHNRHDWYWYGDGEGYPGYYYDPNFSYIEDGVPSVEYEYDTPSQEPAVNVNLEPSTSPSKSQTPSVNAN